MEEENHSTKKIIYGNNNKPWKVKVDFQWLRVYLGFSNKAVI